MGRQQRLQQMVCLGLVLLLVVGCGVKAVQTAVPSPTAPRPTATSIPPTPTATHTPVLPTSTPITPVSLAARPVPPTPTAIAPELIKRLDGKRVLFVLYHGFHETEYGIPRAMLEDLGATAIVASVSPEAVEGHNGNKVQVDVLLANARGGDYDAIVFVGGLAYDIDDLEAQRIAKEAVVEGRVVAAICIAPITLAKADIVRGKRVTIALGSHNLEEAGGIYTGGAVERDGLIITAKGPGDSRRFAEAIAAALAE